LLFGGLGRLGFSLQPRETYLRPFPVEISLFGLCGLPFGRLGHLGFNLQPRDTHLSPVLAERWAVLYKIVYPVLQELFEFALEANQSVRGAWLLAGGGNPSRSQIYGVSYSPVCW